MKSFFPIGASIIGTVKQSKIRENFGTKEKKEIDMENRLKIETKRMHLQEAEVVGAIYVLSIRTRFRYYLCPIYKYKV